MSFHDKLVTKALTSDVNRILVYWNSAVRDNMVRFFKNAETNLCLVVET